MDDKELEKLILNVTNIIGIARGLRNTINEQDPDLLVTNQEILLAMLIYEFGEYDI